MDLISKNTDSNNKVRCFILMLIVTSSFGSAVAYIDPGTAGTLITNGVIPILTTIFAALSAFVLRYLWNPITSFLRKYKNTIIVSALVLLSLGAIIFGMTMLRADKMENSKFNKVLLIGIDGMDPKTLSTLMDSGRLPNFKRLADSGTFMNLNTSNPPHSPVAWTSIATGSNPGKHNIFDFIRIKNGTYLPVLSLSEPQGSMFGTNHLSYVRAEPFWRTASKSGVPTTVIRWPVTFPPEEVNGVMLSGLGVPDVRGLLSGYKFYTTDSLTKEDFSSGKVVQVTNINSTIELDIYGPRTKRGGEIVDISSQAKLAINEDSAELKIDETSYLLKVGEWSDWIRIKFKTGFLSSVYGTTRAYLISTNPFKMYITTMQIDPDHPLIPISYPKDYSSKLADDIGIYYTLGMPEETDGYIDDKINKEAFVGQVNQIETERNKMFWKEFNNFNKKDNGIMAFVFDSSDRIQHVFWRENGTDEVIYNYYIEKDKLLGEVLNSIDNNTLLLVISDHGFTNFSRAVSINTWLVDNGFMALKKELGNEESPLFSNVDWKNTQAYAAGFNSIYVNIKGKSPEGIVTDREKAVSEIIFALENLTDSDGSKVIKKAYRREEIYSGPYTEGAPDIIVGFMPGYRASWQTAVGGFSKEVIYDNNKKWDGDHLVDASFVPGTLLSNIKIDKSSISQMDIAPTILSALGIVPPESMDGRSLI